MHQVREALPGVPTVTANAQVSNWVRGGLNTPGEKVYSNYGLTQCARAVENHSYGVWKRDTSDATPEAAGTCILKDASVDDWGSCMWSTKPEDGYVYIAGADGLTPDSNGIVKDCIRPEVLAFRGLDDRLVIGGFPPGMIDFKNKPNARSRRECIQDCHDDGFDASIYRAKAVEETAGCVDPNLKAKCTTARSERNLLGLMDGSACTCLLWNVDDPSHEGVHCYDPQASFDPNGADPGIKFSLVVDRAKHPTDETLPLHSHLGTSCNRVADKRCAGSKDDPNKACDRAQICADYDSILGHTNILSGCTELFQGFPAATCKCHPGDQFHVSGMSVAVPVSDNDKLIANPTSETYFRCENGWAWSDQSVGNATLTCKDR